MPGYLLIQADARAIPLADNSVDCVVTSPPYWGLRDYGVAGQIGLEPVHDCQGWATGAPCGECWVCQMVAVFREVRRVLKPTGACWVNVGDAYTSGNRAYRDADSLLPARGMHQRAQTPSGLKDKDLCGIPWRFALAMQADGWWLRADVIWAKPNPMPESIKDRPTKAHEYIFMFTKRQRYFYDNEAVREPAANTQHPSALTFCRKVNEPDRPGQTASQHRPDRSGTRRSKAPDGWDRGDGAHGTIHRDGRSKGQAAEIRDGRSLRSVWTIPPQPTPEAHFATFPEALAETCIKAGTSARGVCSSCGRPWERVVEAEPMVTRHGPKSGGYGSRTTDGLSGTMLAPPRRTTSGWRPTCKCPAGEPVPAVVLDPFVGSGTVCRVAERLGRRGVGLDLNMSYLAEIAAPRCARPVQPSLLEAV